MEEYYIELPKKNYTKLIKNIWSNHYLNATLTVNDQTYMIKLGLRGNQLRTHKKKSFHIQFEKPSLMKGQHEIHLNAEYNDPSLMRNKLSFDFFNIIGVLAPESSHVSLYINGKYQGIYLQLESFDEYYLNRRNLPTGSIYYATNDDANFSLYTPEGRVKRSIIDGYTIKHVVQNEEALKKLMIMIATFTKETFCEDINTVLNIEKYFRWLAGVVCTQNFDGFIHNYALYHNSSTQLFEMTPWDYDGTWGRNLHGAPLEHDVVPLHGYNTLTARLLDCPNYKKMYYETMHTILQTSFTTTVQQPHIEKIQTEILPYIEQDPYLKYKQHLFRKEKEFILSFIEKRQHFLCQQLNNTTC